MEEFEVLDLEDLRKDKGMKKTMKMLKSKLTQGYKVSIMIKKLFCFKLPPLQTKKNNFFSKTHHPIEIEDFSDPEGKMTRKLSRSQILEQREASYVSSTSSYTSREASIPKKTVPPTQSNTPNRGGKRMTVMQEINNHLKIQEMQQHGPIIEKQTSIVEESRPHSEKHIVENRISQRSIGSEESSLDQISLFQIRNDQFAGKLRTNVQHHKMQSGLLFYQDGQLSKARDLFKELFQETFDQIENETDSDNKQICILICIQSLCYQAQTQRAVGQLEEANKCLEKCLKTFEINDYDVLGKIYLEIGLNATQQLKLLKAIDYYTRALIIYEKVNWKLDIAKALIKIAHVRALLMNCEDAKKICYQALSLYKLKLGENDIRIYETYHTLGQVFYYAKEYDIAMEYLTQSFQGKKKIYGEKHISMVKTLNLMGLISHLKETPDQAIEYYETSIQIYGGDQQIGLGQIFNNLALAYMDRFKFKTAKISFDKSISILKEYYGETHPIVKRVLKNRELLTLAQLC